MERSEIDESLLADCHYLGSLKTGELLLSRNASIPWFILVPESRLRDVLDLPEEHRNAVLADCALVSEFIKQVLGFDKVNFAGLGNVVPQMHLHIIGRRADDPCWPNPVWGSLPQGEPYEREVLLHWQESLVRLAGLQPQTL